MSYPELLKLLTELQPFINEDVARRAELKRLEREGSPKRNSEWSLIDFAKANKPVTYDNPMFESRTKHIDKARLIVSALKPIADQFIFPYLSSLETDIERKYTFFLIIQRLITFDSDQEKEVIYKEIQTMFNDWMKSLNQSPVGISGNLS